MKSLFPLDTLPLIPGLAYRPSYVSVQEELSLVAAIDRMPWDTSWERRRQPYGRIYGRRDQRPKTIPDRAQALADQMQQDGISREPFDQVLVNDYLPGQGMWTTIPSIGPSHR